MTQVYEVPYHPDDELGWAVRLNGRILARCSSRYEALATAMNEAASAGGNASIGIEGADGVWRPFGTDAKRPGRVPEMPGRRLSAVG